LKTTATSADGEQRMCPLCGRLTDASACPEDGLATVRANAQGFARIGAVVGDRYRLTELLGRGGFGDVYKAFHIGTHESVALKILRPDLGGEASAIDRFTAEARMSAQLHHPNTVRVFDFGTTPDGHLYLAMEFLDGESLEVLLEAAGRLPPRRTVHLCLQILRSLVEAHGKHIVHRDLKPDNIFVVELAGERDFVRVIDFGIAKFLGDSQQLTVSGAILGTPHYMSPEQIRGEALDARSDLYGLGVVMYRCLTGQFPCVGDNQFGILAAHLTEPPPPMRKAGVDIDPALEAVVLRALQKDRASRYADADAMRQALEAWQASAPPDPVVHSDTQAMDTLPVHDPDDGSQTLAMAVLPVVTDAPVPAAPPSTAQDDLATQALDVLVLPEPAAAPEPSRSVVVHAPTALPVQAPVQPVQPVRPVVDESTRIGLELVAEPPIRAAEAPAPRPLGPTATARRPSGIERRPEPPARKGQPVAEGKSRQGLQRRSGRPSEVVRAEVARTEARDTATRAMDVLTVTEHATERGVTMVSGVKTSRSWLVVGVTSLLLFGGGLGVLLALRAREEPAPRAQDAVPAPAPPATVPPAAPEPAPAQVAAAAPARAAVAPAPVPPAAVVAPIAVPAPQAPTATAAAPSSAAVEPAVASHAADKTAQTSARKRDKVGCSAAEGSVEWCKNCPDAAKLTSRSKAFCACREARGDTAGLPYYCACRFPGEHHAAGSAPWCTCNAGDPACD
jgi:hypothetical protein